MSLALRMPTLSRRSMPPTSSIDHLLAELREGMAADWVALEPRIERLKRRGASPNEIERLTKAVAASRERARRRAPVLLGTFPEVGLDGRTFDVVNLKLVMEHVPDLAFQVGNEAGPFHVDPGVL